MCKGDRVVAQTADDEETEEKLSFSLQFRNSIEGILTLITVSKMIGYD